MLVSGLRAPLSLFLASKNRNLDFFLLVLISFAPLVKKIISLIKVVEGKENDCEKESTARIKKSPPAVFNFIDEQL